MQTQSDNLSRVLRIPGYHVVDCEVNEAEIHLRIERDERQYRCPKCKQLLLWYYDCRDRTVQDLPAFGQKVFLTFTQYRLRCPCSGKVVTEELDFVEPRQHQTCRFQQAIYFWLKTGTTTKKAAKAFGLSWDQVRHIDERLIRQEQENESYDDLRRLCVDEKAIGRGHDYITIVSDLDKGRVVFVAEGRKKSSLDKFYRHIGSERASRIELITMDMWGPYIQSTKEHAPQADIVFDKFHILRQLNAKIDALRRQLQKRKEAAGYKVVKRSRWVLLKANENLTESQRYTLSKIAEDNEELYKAYLLREQFRALFVPTELKLALDRLADWMREVYESGLKPMIKFVQQCGRWFEGLVNYFKHGVTNALSEALNSKIALMLKLSNGIGNRDYFLMKIYQQCGDLH